MLQIALQSDHNYVIPKIEGHCRKNQGKFFNTHGDDLGTGELGEIAELAPGW